MERDFMGLLPKSWPITVKQEVDDGFIEPAAMRGSGLQWSFQNSASTSPQILSFKSAQDRGVCHKLYPLSSSQKNLPLDRQGGSPYPNTGHHWQHNQMAPSAITSVPPSYLSPNGTNVVTSTVGVVSAVSSASISPPNCPVVGSTDLRSSSSISTGPCQLTIFYNGSVCVYDNVSPEKAQAIMLLAGNGDSTNSSGPADAIPLAPKLQRTVLRPPANDNAIPNQSLGFSSSISLPQPVSSLPAVASSCAPEVTTVKPAVSPAPVKCPEPAKSAPRVGAGGVNFIPSAVPQARKASLARFLEKRKERVIGASPYAVSKNSSESSAAGPGGLTFATNSATSSPLPASN